MQLYTQDIVDDLLTTEPVGISILTDSQLQPEPTVGHLGTCLCLDCRGTRILTAYQAR